MLLAGMAIANPDKSTKKRKGNTVKWVDASSKPEEKKDIATVIVDKEKMPPVDVHKITSNDSLKPIMRPIENLPAANIPENFAAIQDALYCSPVTAIPTKEIPHPPAGPLQNQNPPPMNEPDMVSMPIQQKNYYQKEKQSPPESKRIGSAGSKGKSKNQSEDAKVVGGNIKKDQRNIAKEAFVYQNQQNNPTTKYISEDPRDPRRLQPDILASLLNNNGINNIIIQNPQRVEVNAFISRGFMEPKKIDAKRTKVFLFFMFIQ